MATALTIRRECNIKKHPWYKMHASVWLSDIHLKQCKWEGKGLLADLMAMAHHGTPRGYVTNGGLSVSDKEIAKNFGETEKKTKKLMQKLLDTHRIGLTDDGTIYIPSMVRETAQAEKAATDGAKGGNPDLKKPSTSPLTPEVNPPVKPEQNRTETEIDKNRTEGNPDLSVGEEEQKTRYLSSSGISTALHGTPNKKVLKANILAYSLKEIRYCWEQAQEAHRNGGLRKPPIALCQSLLKLNLQVPLTAEEKEETAMKSHEQGQKQIKALEEQNKDQPRDKEGLPKDTPPPLIL